MADWRDVSVWQRLDAEGGGADGVIAAAALVDSREAAAIARLRKRFDADLVAAALELAQGRRKAREKCARFAELWCDTQGVEQASSDAVAAWKAARMRSVLGSGAEVIDCCCGIGGDAMALTAAGLVVEGMDLDPRRAWMTGRNAGCATRAVDVESIELAGAVLHADPARRDERGSRSWSLDDHKPGRAWIERALTCARAAAIKFSPGVDRRAFGELAIEWEFIEDRGTLVQAIAWSGAFALAPRCTRATVLVDGASSSLCGSPDDARDERIGVSIELPVGAYLSEPTPALERAQLLSEATRGSGAREISRGLGLVTSAQSLESPWFESFEIVEETSSDASSINALLRARKLTPRSVRVRGVAADADALTRTLHCTPAGNAVIFVWREGRGARAVVTRVLFPEV